MDAGGPIVSGHRFMKLEEYHAAIAQYTKATELEPNNPDGYKGRGQAYFQLGKNQKALEDFNKSIELDSKCSENAYFLRGTLWYLKQDYDKALSDFDEALRMNHQFAEVYYHRSLVHERIEEITKAIADMKKYIHLRPGDSKSVVRLIKLTTKYLELQKKKEQKKIPAKDKERI